MEHTLTLATYTCTFTHQLPPLSLLHLSNPLMPQYRVAAQDPAEDSVQHLSTWRTEATMTKMQHAEWSANKMHM